MNYLITGCNRGIGLELCKQLSNKETNNIFAVCRNVSDDLEALSINENLTVIDSIDLTKEEDLVKLESKLKSYLGNSKLDVLINNAGVWGPAEFGELSFESLESVFVTNAVAPLMLTQHLKKYLAKNSKVMMVTSRMGSIADNDTGGRYSYRMSKAALNAATKSLSIDLKQDGIIVGLIHPGHVATDMGGSAAPVSPEESVHNILKCIEEYSLETTGEFWHAKGELLPW